MKRKKPAPPGPRLAGLTLAVVWAYLVLVAWLTTESTYSFSSATALAWLYALFAAALVTGGLAVGCFGPTGRPFAALMVGLTLGWHWREQTRIPGTGATLWTLEGMMAWLPIVGILGTALYLLETATAQRGGAKRTAMRSFAICAVTSAVFFVFLAGTFFATNTARWHLIRHNQMIGTLAFHLFATPVAKIESVDWSTHRSGLPIGQPPWVRDPIESSDPRPPDIVFLMIDTLRADALAALGGDPEWMPRLNRLASEATLFTDVEANAPWTQPSVASFFTGLLPEEHGVISISHRLTTSAVTLAEALQARGYETAAFVANGVIVNPESGFQRGFDVFEYVVDPPAAYARADRVSREVSSWLAERSAGVARAAQPVAPLFLYVHYLDPHVPYLSSGPAAQDTASLMIEDAARYYRHELRFLDAQLARLLATLDAALPGPRALLLTSDHGEELGEHDGLGHSQSLYSEVLDIPAILQVRGSVAKAPADRLGARLEGRDFFDLLLRLGSGEIADVAVWAATVDRTSRIASLHFEKDPGRSALVHYLLRPYRARIYGRMIERHGWRYIWSAFGPTDELYDLAADPLERDNVADVHRDRVESMRAALDRSPPYRTQLAPLEISSESLESLRQLGYIR